MTSLQEKYFNNFRNFKQALRIVGKHPGYHQLDADQNVGALENALPSLH